MIFNQHSDLEGLHAFLSASKYHWLNYTDEKLEETYINWKAAERGTILHEFAKDRIIFRAKLPDESRTINLYVNDAIDFNMIPEQILYYSSNCFGTADAIIFDEDNNILRIHDLKTGISKTSFKQIYIYCGLFCLEYHKDPLLLNYILRIYQNNEYREEEPDPEIIFDVCEKIKEADKRLNIINKRSI